MKRQTRDNICFFRFYVAWHRTSLIPGIVCDLSSINSSFRLELPNKLFVNNIKEASGNKRNIASYGVKRKAFHQIGIWLFEYEVIIIFANVLIC